jgi:hypothetical protein
MIISFVLQQSFMHLRISTFAKTLGSLLLDFALDTTIRIQPFFGLV